MACSRFGSVHIRLAQGGVALAIAARDDSWGGCHAGKTPTGAAKADASLGKLLTTKSVILGGMIFAFQQFAGINAIIYFSSSVFAQA